MTRSIYHDGTAGAPIKPLVPKTASTSEGAKEDKAGWSGFLKHLKARGLAGIGDDELSARQLAGLEVLQEAAPARLVLLSAL